MSSHVCRPDDRRPGAPTEVATKDASDGDEAVVVEERADAAVVRSRAAAARAPTRSGTLATALLPAEPWSHLEDDLAGVGIGVAWIATGSDGGEDARVEQSRTTTYAVVAGVHFGGVWPAQSVASVAIVHGVVPFDAARRVVAHGAEEAAVELRLDAIERVAGERRTGGRLPPVPSSRTRPRSLA